MFLIVIAAILFVGHIVMTSWILKGVDDGWSLLDDERHSPLYCLTAEDLTSDVKPPKIRGPKPTFDEDGYYPCLPQRLDHASPHKTKKTWPEALCFLSKRLDLLPEGDHRCA